MRTRQVVVATEPTRTRRMAKVFAAVAVTSCLFVGGSRVVRGSTTNDVDRIDPDPYATPSLGSGAITYDRMSASQQDDVDSLQQELDTSQSADSVTAFSRATADTASRARVELEARTVGLSGTEQDGL